jgi:hypothetical protein
MIDQIDHHAMAAQQFGVNADALKCLLSFVTLSLLKPECQAAFDKDPEQFLSRAVEAWHEKSRAFHTELLAGETQRSQEWRGQIAEEVGKLAGDNKEAN